MIHTYMIVYIVACWTLGIVGLGYYNSRHRNTFSGNERGLGIIVISPILVPLVIGALPFMGLYELGKYIHGIKKNKETRAIARRERNRIQPGHIR